MTRFAFIKESERASRKGCAECRSMDPFYWGELRVTGDDGGIVSRGMFLFTKTDATKTADKGDALPIGDLHACEKWHRKLSALGVPGYAPGSGDAVPPGDEPMSAESEPMSDELRQKFTDTPADETDPFTALTASETAEPARGDAIPGGNDIKAALATLAGAFAQPAPPVDVAEVERIATRVATKAVEAVIVPTRTVVVRNGERHEVPGLTHQSLARVIAAVSVGEDVMLVGPAGTGKSHIGGQVATALGLDFYLAPSLTAQTGEAKFTGFVDANGTYHGTAAYEWATNERGGIYLLDELDNGNPNVNGWWNSALANREIRFPNGHIAKLGPNHRVIATANTYGFGRTRAYVGRNPIDAATKNRFAVITIKIDEALESALVAATGVTPATGTKILDYIGRLRKASDATGIDAILSPRNSVGMAKLLTNEAYDFDMAVDDRLRDGIPDESWAKLTDAAGRP